MTIAVLAAHRARSFRRAAGSGVGSPAIIAVKNGLTLSSSRWIQPSRHVGHAAVTTLSASCSARSALTRSAPRSPGSERPASRCSATNPRTQSGHAYAAPPTGRPQKTHVGSAASPFADASTTTAPVRSECGEASGGGAYRDRARGSTGCQTPGLVTTGARRGAVGIAPGRAWPQVITPAGPRGSTADAGGRQRRLRSRR